MVPWSFTETQSLTPKQRTAGNLEQDQAQSFETAAAATDLYIALRSLLKLSLFMFSEH